MKHFKTTANMLDKDFHNGNNPAYDRVAFVAEKYPELVEMYRTILERIKTADFSIDNTLNIKTVGNNYTTQKEDFDGNTYIRVDTTDQTGNIYLTLPLQEFEGKSLVIRKVSGNQDSILNIIPEDGVTIIPSDITPLRRIGSTATLIYIGDGIYDAFGELA